ncbi:MAG: hypothetical protein Q8Q59_08380 [Luteolibacter sp.]|jgi:uncharacterized phage infection (PIP) family protein YhgE|nr:hypothetical protein [Luteolibacter sp.]
MANDNDIKIGIKTVGADEAAREIDKMPAAIDKIPESIPTAVDAIDEVPKAIDEIPKSVPDAVDAIDKIPEAIDEIPKSVPDAVDALDDIRAKLEEIDVIEAKRRVAAREAANDRGVLGTDISGAVDAGAGGVADQLGVGRKYRSVSKLISADAAAVAGSIAAIGMAAVKSYQFLDGTIARFDQLKKLAAETGQTLGPELEIQLEALRETMGPVKTVLDTVGGALEKVWKTVKDPLGELSGANELEAAFKRQAEMAAKLLKTRREIASENQTGLAETYGRELAALNDQEATMRRIAALRNELAGLEVQGAAQEVDAARLRGGDVALAEANELAVRLRAGLAKLGDNLRESQQGAELARTELDQAMAAYQQGIKDKVNELDPEKFLALSTAVDDKQKAFADANQAVADQQQIFETGKLNLLRGVENEFTKMEQDTKGDISPAAKAARDGIYQTLQEQVATLGSATGEVKQAMDANRDQTLQAIQQLAPKPADTAKVQGAVDTASQGIDGFGNAVIASLAKLSAVVSQLTQKVGQQDSRIDQLFGRLR